MTPAKDNMKVAVVGGGIGGVVTTIALLRQNINVQLYEATNDYRELGGGIIFGPNTLRIMERINPAMLDAYHVCATTNAWKEKQDIWWEFRHGVQPAEVPETPPKLIAAVKAPGVGHASAKRPHFLGELVKLIPKGICHFGKRLTGAQDLGLDGVDMHFTDGSIERADLVIGCDGIKSQLRKVVLGNEDAATLPVFTKKYAWRALLPMEVAAKAMGDEYARNAQMFLGPHSHVLTVPLEKGATMQIVTVSTREDWLQEKWVVEADQNELFGALEGWVAPVRNILPLIKTTQIWALFDSIPARTYTNGSRICLLGDAAHASTPHQGSGGGMAMEDAFILSKLLGQILDVNDISAILKVYDLTRRPRSQKLVSSSREAGQLYDLELTEPGDDETLRMNLENRFKWIWEADPDKELAEAQKLLNEEIEATNLKRTVSESNLQRVIAFPVQLLSHLWFFIAATEKRP